MAHKKPVKLIALLGTVTLAGGLVSCMGLPAESNPEVIRSFIPSTPTTTDGIAPIEGREPDLMLRDFFTALASPVQSHQAARQFLVSGIAEKWSDQRPTTIVDRVVINARPGGTATHIEYVVRGSIVGTILNGGSYLPSAGDYEEVFTMDKVDGEWRIASLPDGVVLERTEFRNNYEPQELYFFDGQEKYLVRDRRFMYNNQPSLDTSLLSLLVAGPSPTLIPAVVNKVPEGAAFAGYQDGAYAFTGFGELSKEERLKFGAQVVWTLAHAGYAGPFNITLDGAPVDESGPLSVDSVAEFNPNAGNTAISQLFVIKDGSLLSVSNTGTQQVAGPLGYGKDLIHADVVGNPEIVAGVLRTGQDQQQLLVGPLTGQAVEALRGTSLSRPSWEPGATGVWAVVDGDKIIRVARSTTSGELTTQDVDLAALVEADLENEVIEQVRLDSSGVRIALVVAGSLYQAVVYRPNPGERRVLNIVKIAPSLEGTVTSVDWQRDGSMVVATTNPAAPVWRVEMDGSAATPLTAGNVQAPVAEVAAGNSTIYIADERATLQLPVAASNQYWREVPSLQGTRAIPLVAH